MSGDSSRILLGMSGGVDSSVSAYNLKRDGHEVVGVTLLALSGEKAEARVQHAADVAEQLGVEHHVVDVRERFERDVIEWYLEEVSQGLQPDPIVRFNDVILFPTLFSQADELDCPQVATGHYASVTAEEVGVNLLPHQLRVGTEKKRAQTYLLAGLSQEQLARLVFPLYFDHCSWVARAAMQAGIERVVPTETTYAEPFFFEGKGRAGWLREQGALGEPGQIVNVSTREVLGQHEGLAAYELGQEVPGLAEGSSGASAAADAADAGGGADDAADDAADGASYENKEARSHELEVALGLSQQLEDGIVNRGGKPADTVEALSIGMGASSVADSRVRGANLRVIAKDPETNTLYVGPRNLTRVELARVRNLHWTSIEPPEKKLPCRVCFSWGGLAYPARVVTTGEDGTGVIVFTEGVTGVASGQTAVLYSDDLVLGRAEIA